MQVRPIGGLPARKLLDGGVTVMAMILVTDAEYGELDIERDLIG
ncbi:hypothetical protein [Nonomuraea diastatica]|nr:hypothetical protein [Nonomuraea diastatica]